MDEVSKLSIAVRSDDSILYEILQKAVLSIDDFVKDEEDNVVEEDNDTFDNNEDTEEN